VIIPDKADREFINHSIFNELLKEIYKKTTKQIFLNIIGTLKDRGAEGIILGCTEIPLIIKDEDSELPLFNTTLIHSLAAVEFALK
jgi:aspartate racemase